MSDTSTTPDPPSAASRALLERMEELKVELGAVKIMRDDSPDVKAAARRKRAELKAALGEVTGLYRWMSSPADTNGLRARVIRRDKSTCRYCGAFLADAAITLDHIVPRCRGGHSSYRNLVVACATCNHSKGDLDLNDWFAERHCTPKQRRRSKASWPATERDQLPVAAEII